MHVHIICMKTTKDYLSYILEYKMEVKYMNEDRKKMNIHEEDELSNMIHEYSEDNELRRKINELKRQKEEEKRIYEAKLNTPQESIFDRISDTGTIKNVENTMTEKGIPDIRVDDTLIEKTRVGFEDQPAYDKTLVIMDNKTKASALEDTRILDRTATSMFSDDDTLKENQKEEDNDIDDEVVYEDEEEDDDNLLSFFNKRKKDKKKKHDDSEEEDIQDDAKNQKMNKIITYIIIGIVGICIVVASFFGVRYALSKFFGGSGDKDKVTETTDPTDKEENTENQPTNNENGGSDQGDDSVNIETNEAEKTRLEKQLEQYQSQLDEVNKQLETEQKNLSDAETELESYKDLFNQAVTLQSQSDEVYTALDKVNKLASYQNSSNPDEKKQYDDALQAYKDTCSKYGVADYQEIHAKAKAANDDYNSKSQTAEKKKSDAESAITTLEKRKTDLESKIADTTTELNNYN